MQRKTFAEIRAIVENYPRELTKSNESTEGENINAKNETYEEENQNIQIEDTFEENDKKRASDLPNDFEVLFSKSDEPTEEENIDTKNKTLEKSIAIKGSFEENDKKRTSDQGDNVAHELSHQLHTVDDLPNEMKKMIASSLGIGYFGKHARVNYMNSTRKNREFLKQGDDYLRERDDALNLKIERVTKAFKNTRDSWMFQKDFAGEDVIIFMHKPTKKWFIWKHKTFPTKVLHRTGYLYFTRWTMESEGVRFIYSGAEEHPEYHLSFKHLAPTKGEEILKSRYVTYSITGQEPGKPYSTGITWSTDYMLILNGNLVRMTEVKLLKNSISL